MRHIRVGGMALSPPRKSCKVCPPLHYCDELLKLIVRTPDQDCSFMLWREREKLVINLLTLHTTSSLSEMILFLEISFISMF